MAKGATLAKSEKSTLAPITTKKNGTKSTFNGSNLCSNSYVSFVSEKINPAKNAPIIAARPTYEAIADKPNTTIRMMTNGASFWTSFSSQLSRLKARVL